MNDPEKSLNPHPATVKFSLKVQNRFWRSFHKGKPDECWPWIARLNPCGYGKLFNEGREISAHRASWLMHKGQIPEGMCVLHTCDNPPCVNPSHLWLGTQKDNGADKAAKRRSKGPIKLTVEQVLEIRRRRATGEMEASIAHDFGVSRPTVGQIFHRKTWNHV